MFDLSELELAVIEAVARQSPGLKEVLLSQKRLACVAQRQNTGGGFYTSFKTNPTEALNMTASPIGNIHANIAGLAHGMGFVLWLQDGQLSKLEGYSFAENTTEIDFQRVKFEIIDADNAG